MEENHLTPAILIAGPTASGKSAAALQVAEAVDGEIINADAMQVYQDLRVLTARPAQDEMRRVPHHLYGKMDGAEKCSAGVWARQAAAIIEEVRVRGRYPVIVGGTGLYFKALDEGLSPIPDVPASVREAAQELYDDIGPEAFRQKVIAVDPLMARLPAADRQRLVRAWEVFAHTALPLSEFQALPKRPLIEGPILKAIINPPRETLYAHCDTRFDHMIAAGAVREVEALLARQLPASLPVMKSLGVPELASYLAGDADLEGATELAKRHTRRFAKRQMTWFNGQTADWPRFADAKEAVAFLVENCSITG